jgi:phosphatidylglycerol:prolipoprotein diacylglycerol transferase
MYPVVHLGPLAFHSFGLLFGLAVCLGWFTFTGYLRAHRIHVDALRMAVVLVGSALLGGKLDAAFVSSVMERHGSFLAALSNIAFGYTYLGAIAGGALATLVYARFASVPPVQLFDSLFCVGPSYAVARIGCFFAGDGDYGRPSSLPWAMSFPHGVVPTLARVHPTMLYSSAWEFAVFAILWRLSDPRRQPPLRQGTLLGCYLIASGTGRFMVEFLSRNRVLAFGLTEAQLVSAAMTIGGGLILGYVFLRHGAEKHGLGPGTPRFETPGS